MRPRREIDPDLLQAITALVLRLTNGTGSKGVLQTAYVPQTTYIAASGGIKGSGPLTGDIELSLNVPWTNWTPTVSQSGSSVSCTVTEAKYAVMDKVCHIYADIEITGSGSSAGDAAVAIGGIPSAVQPAHYDSHFAVGSGLVLDAGTASVGAQLIAVTASTFKFLGYNVGNYVGLVPNFALANGDQITLTGTYRIA
jgi:hypothetical protein